MTAIFSPNGELAEDAAGAPPPNTEVVEAVEAAALVVGATGVAAGAAKAAEAAFPPNTDF